MNKTGWCLHRAPGIPLEAPRSSGSEVESNQKEGDFSWSRRRKARGAGRHWGPGQICIGPAVWGEPGEHPDFWVWLSFLLLPVLLGVLHRVASWPLCLL